MNLLREFARTLCVASLAVTATTSAIAAADDERFVVALQLYHDGHYSAAYGRLVALADGGHADAARIALLMVRFGRRLYDCEWSASASQIEYWIALASRNLLPFVADGGD
jgi:hypothetical protein